MGLFKDLFTASMSVTEAIGSVVVDGGMEAAKGASKLYKDYQKNPNIDVMSRTADIVGKSLEKGITCAGDSIARGYQSIQQDHAATLAEKKKSVMIDKSEYSEDSSKMVVKCIFNNGESNIEQFHYSDDVWYKSIGKSASYLWVKKNKEHGISIDFSIHNYGDVYDWGTIPENVIRLEKILVHLPNCDFVGTRIYLADHNFGFQLDTVDEYLRRH